MNKDIAIVLGVPLHNFSANITQLMHLFENIEYDVSNVNVFLNYMAAAYMSFIEINKIISLSF